MTRPLQYFTYKNRGLSVDGVPLAKIAEAVGTPAYVYSAAAFLGPLRKLQKGLAGLDATLCYAVKSNSNIAILRLLEEAGAGADLVSGGELYRAGLAHIPGERIVFSGVGKTPGEIAQALLYQEDGIFSFNVESVSELEMIDEVARRLGRRARVALRFNPDVNPKTHPYISTGLKKNKFGITRGEILEIALRPRRSPGDLAGIALRGLSIHIGSQLLSLSPLNDAFTKTRALIDELNGILPEPLAFVDLGGGIGITYRNESPPTLEKYCALVHRHFGTARRGRTGESRSPLKILLEPGRILSGNSGVLLTTVLHRKQRREKDFLIVDAAMNDLIRPSLYGSYHEIVPVQAIRGPRSVKKTDIVGPVCETGDCFAIDRLMSRRISQGDLLAVLSAGAYGFTMSGNYNSRPRPPEILARDGKFQVIRARETYEDLVRGELGPEAGIPPRLSVTAE